MCFVNPIYNSAKGGSFGFDALELNDVDEAPANDSSDEAAADAQSTHSFQAHHTLLPETVVEQAD